MSAALSYPRVAVSSLSAESARHAPPTALAPVALPAELAVLFEESAKAESTYYLLDEHDRVGFVKFIELATTAVARERRAAIVATSLIGLAASLASSKRS